MRMITVCPDKFSHFRVWYRDALFEDVREMQLEARTLSRPCLERDGLPGSFGHKGNKGAC
jgi:hypothetical protein